VFDKNKETFLSCFQEIEDPREDKKLLYPMNEILFLVISAVLSSAESWEQIVKYGESKLKLLRKYFPYEHGIPAKSTICTVMGLIEIKQFEKWLIIWVDSFSCNIPEELIAIDGKTLRGSKRREEKGLHVLNAFAIKRGIVLAQRAVNKKTNEITELPKLLDDLNISGAVISTDAMGCQKKVANKIIEKKADYILALKGNQGHLHEQIKSFFTEKNKEKADFSKSLDKGHGRVETRKCWSMPIPRLLKEDVSDWKNLQSINLITNERHMGENVSTENRIYISSLQANAKKHLEYVRSYWQIENNVHWVLDVTFKEDLCLVKNAAENMSVIRKVIMNLVKKYKDKTGNKTGPRIIRKSAGWDEEVTEGILNCLFV